MPISIWISSRSHGGHKSDIDDMIRDGKFLDAPDRKGSGHGFYSSSSSDKYHGHDRYHCYRKGDKGYLSDEFKKAKTPTFDGELKKPTDAKAWLIVMKKFFKLHDYTENLKAKIVIYSLKGKEDIWW